MRRRALSEVRLNREDRHGYGSRRKGILKLLLLDAAHREGGVVLLLAVEVDAVVFAGVGRGGCPLDAQPRPLTHEVVLLAKSAVEVDVY